MDVLIGRYRVGSDEQEDQKAWVRWAAHCELKAVTLIYRPSLEDVERVTDPDEDLGASL